MRRTLALGTLMLVGITVATVAGLRGQQPPGGPVPGRGGPGRGGPGFAPVGKPQKISDNLYWLAGGGGNTAIFITANGVVLVDTKVPNTGQAILDQVKSVTDKPVTLIVNTHTHGDHVGSNAFFPASVEVVTQENTAANMRKMDDFKAPAAMHGLPDRTFKDKLTLLGGADAIDLYYFGRAHTNGDAFVVFRNARVMHAGDVFAGKEQAAIDPGNGGSGVEYGATMDRASKGIRNVETVITGHSDTPMKWQDFVDYGEFNRLFVVAARDALRAGQSPEQAMMAFRTGLPAKFKDYDLAGGPAGRGGPAGNFSALFEELRSSTR